MLTIGLTGGIGTGKSTVSSLLKAKGIPVIDADNIAREVLVIYPEILHRIKEIFGEEFFDEHGTLKRKELGSYIFKNKERQKQLEGVIIPYIKREIFKQIDDCCFSQETSICIIDAPTLIENGLHKDMDKNILVWVDNKTQFERVKDRDKLSDEEVENRITAQMPLEEKRRYVDFIIDNSGKLEDTKKRVEEILEQLLRR